MLKEKLAKSSSSTLGAVVNPERLRELQVGARFEFPDDPGMSYRVTAGIESGRDRVDAEALDTGMSILPSFVFQGSELVCKVQR